MKAFVANAVLVAAATWASISWSADADTTLASVRIGSPVHELFDAFPGLYVHRLMLGELLYEACNQKTLDVFTFTEEPWSRGRVTRIWVRREPVSVCRDETGSLPDVGRAAATPRGLAVGDPESKVRELYGEPKDVRAGQSEQKHLRYELPSTEKDVVGVVLSVSVTGTQVSGFSLSADIAGARKPK